MIFESAVGLWFIELFLSGGHAGLAGIGAVVRGGVGMTQGERRCDLRTHYPVPHPSFPQCRADPCSRSAAPGEKGSLCMEYS